MDPLAQEIAAFIQNPPRDPDAAFDALALALFARQYALNAPYQRLCDSYGTTPGGVNHWRDIPAVPAAAFKAFELSCAPVKDTVAVFHSSGTTGAQTSKHFFDAGRPCALYETSLRAGFAQRPAPAPAPAVGADAAPRGRAPLVPVAYAGNTGRGAVLLGQRRRAGRRAGVGLQTPSACSGPRLRSCSSLTARAQIWRLPAGQCGRGNRRLQRPDARSPA